jgi:radical SAM protein with 4Fe4S-binding SPASM domain
MPNKYEIAELKIELTQECPLACIHCSTRSNRFAKSALPTQVVMRLLREAHDMGAKKVAITGGEPLVYADLDGVLRTASSLALATTLYTTGIKNNNLDPIDAGDVSRLFSAGLVRIIFSIYAANPQIHESITGFPSFGPTLEAVKRCVQSGLPVEFHFVPLRQNYLQFPEVVLLAQRLAVPKVSVLRFVPQGRGAKIRQSQELTTEEHRRFGRIVGEFGASGPVQVRLGAPMNILGLSHTCCDAAQDVIVIDHRGRVFPCDAFKGMDYADPIYGSVLDNSLQSVWQRSNYLGAVRHLHAERRDGCSSCPTGCLAQEAVRRGGIDQLVQLSASESCGKVPEQAADLVELKVCSAEQHVGGTG